MALGQLIVELAVNSARMQGGFDSARSMAQKFSSDLKQSFNQLGSSFSALGAELGASFGPIGGIIGGVTQGVSALSAALKTASFGAETFKVAAVGAVGLGGASLMAAAGFFKLSAEGAKATEELERSALKLGVTTTQMAGLKAAAEFVDVPIKTLTRGFAQFAKVLGDIDNPTNKSAALLRSMGVQAGTGTYDGLVKATSAISGMQDPVQRMNAATQLFGRRIGLELLPMLSDAKHGLQSFSDMARESGVVIEENGIHRSQEWKEANDRLAMSWEGVKIKAFDANSSMIEATNWLSRFINTATDESTWDIVRDNFSIFKGIGGQLAGLDTKIELSSKVSQEHNKVDPDAQNKAAAAKAEQAALDVQNKRVAAAKRLADMTGAITASEKELAQAEEDVRDTENSIATLHTGTRIEIAKQQEALWGQVKTENEHIAALKERIALEKHSQEETNKFLAETHSLTKETASTVGKGEGETKNQREIASIKELIGKWEQYSLDYPKAIAIANQHVNELQHELSSKMEEESYNQKQWAMGMIPGYKEVSKEIHEIISDKQKEATEWVAASQRMHTADATQAADMAKIRVQAANQETMYGINKGGGNDKAKVQAQLDENKALAQIQIDQINDEAKWHQSGDAKDLEMLRKFEDEKQKIIANSVKEQAKIVEDAELEKEQKIRAAEDRTARAIASTAAKSIVEGKNMGQAFSQLGKQMLETALTNFLQMETLDGRKKMKEARKAGRGAYTGVMDMNLPPMIGFPLAIASGAAAFAGVMAFEKGGIVPETGMVKLHEKEMVLPRPISEKVQAMTDAGAGGKGSSPAITYAPTIHAVDGKGVSDMLNAHGGLFTQHIVKELRRRNMV
jgi:hypothetical protein